MNPIPPEFPRENTYCKKYRFSTISATFCFLGLKLVSNAKPTGDMMNQVDDEDYKYIGVLKDVVTKNRDMKETVGKEYLRRVKQWSKSKLYPGNLQRVINGQATVEVTRYSALILP